MWRKTRGAREHEEQLGGGSVQEDDGDAGHHPAPGLPRAEPEGQGRVADDVHRVGERPPGRENEIAA